MMCDMPQYDKWYREVLEGRRKCFYPYRIRLLENFEAPLFLYHSHHHAIMGEAKIVRATKENGRHFYWFKRFIAYRYKVRLELLETNQRVQRLSVKGRWRYVYISRETVEEIRNLSNLSERARKNLGKDIEEIIEKLGLRWEPPKRDRWKHFMDEECEKLKRNYILDDNVLDETKDIFSKAVEKKMVLGRSYKELFYGSLYLALRSLGVSALLIDVSNMSGLSTKRIGKSYRLLLWNLKRVIPLISPKQLVKSRAASLGISHQSIHRAIQILEEAMGTWDQMGKAPSSLAAAATFLACREKGENKTQKEVATLFGVTDVTIRKYLDELESILTSHTCT